MMLLLIQAQISFHSKHFTLFFSCLFFPFLWQGKGAGLIFSFFFLSLLFFNITKKVPEPEKNKLTLASQSPTKPDLVSEGKEAISQFHLRRKKWKSGWLTWTRLNHLSAACIREFNNCRSDPPLGVHHDALNLYAARPNTGSEILGMPFSSLG